MIQYLLAALLVFLAAAYAAWRLMPATWQLQLLQAADRGLSSALSPTWLHRSIARGIEARLSAGAGCGSCSSSGKREP